MSSSLIDQIEREVKAKNVRKAVHPTKPLAIYNYAEKVQYTKAWTPLLMHCRGLILDLETGAVVARPMRKFFNYSENKHVTSETEPFDVMEKLDGSLGQLCWYKNEWIFTSRGSFISEQAAEGMRMIRERKNLDDLDKQYTYIFEIIYPANRIVVHYGARRDLVLLAVTKGDDDLPLTDVQTIARSYGFSVAKTVQPLPPAELGAQNLDNQEGYVLRFRSTGERVKIKFDQYVAMHRIETNFSLKHVKAWFLQDPNMIIEEKLDHVPDENFDDVRETWTAMRQKYDHERSSFHTEATKCEHTVFKDVPDSPMRALICKYLRLIRSDPSASSSSVKEDISREWAMNCMKEFPVKKLNTFQDRRPLTPAVKPTATLLLLIGASGSGKSTFARSYINRLDNKGVIVSRDIIRQCLPDTPSEDLVNTLQHAMILSAIREHKTIIIDNTNLQAQYIQNFFKKYHSLVSDIRVKLFDQVTVDECIERVNTRLNGAQVPATVIRKQYAAFLKVKEDQCWERLSIEFPCEVIKTKATYKQTPSRNNVERKPSTIIFDCDGTLTLNVHGRSPYDERRVLQDWANVPIVKVCRALQKNVKIIICTGRTEGCRGDTEIWLRKNGILYDSLHMRAIDDTRADYIIKQEMWETIEKDHFILAMFDDRDSVVKHARKLGYCVAQVAEGDF